MWMIRNIFKGLMRDDYCFVVVYYEVVLVVWMEVCDFEVWLEVNFEDFCKVKIEEC